MSSGGTQPATVVRRHPRAACEPRGLRRGRKAEGVHPPHLELRAMQRDAHAGEQPPVAGDAALPQLSGDALGQLETLLHAAGLAVADRNGCEPERLMALSEAVDAMSARAAAVPATPGPR